MQEQDNEKKYVVAWHIPRTNARGQGTKKLTYEVAKEYVRAMQISAEAKCALGEIDKINYEVKEITPNED